MKKPKVGLQLYSIRKAMTEDMDSALAKVKAMGYDNVEFSGGRYGRSAAETRALLDKHGLICISVHQSPSFYETDPVDAVEYVKILGAKFCVIPICRLSVYQENWEETMALYKEMAAAFRKEGIRLLYHNHDHELTCLPGDSTPILDKIFTEVPELKPEFDTCWISYGGVDPVSYIQKYNSDLDLVHLKDYCCEALPQFPMWQLMKDGYQKPEKRSDVRFQYLPVGEGVENWTNILSAIQDSTANYVIVEQDESRDRDPMDAVRMSRQYLKKNFNI
ncbi:MAG: sugar phosphate isomerase/epimerase [Oscillospiraceae bacterium]|nr:sugar phosphate isomerase/epimerase [Oscillospiraceae bacterium]